MNLRKSRVLNNIAGAFIIKGGSVIVGVLTIPAYMRYFPNATILGVWYTLLSLLTWILNFDLGIGNGMRNLLVPSFLDNDYSGMKKTISSAYFSIGVASAIFTVLGLTLTFIFNWNDFLNVSQEIIPARVLRMSTQVVLCGIIGQFFFKLIAAVLNAMERNALTNALPLLSNLMILLFVSLPSSKSEPEKIMILSYVYVVAVNVPYIMATILIFRGVLKKSRPSFRDFEWNIAKNILTLGGRFFGVQLALIIITVTNEIMITRLYGARYVVDFQVYNKIFYTIVTLFSLITNPIWSAVTTAFYAGRVEWIKKAYRKVIVIAAMVSLLLVGVAFAFKYIVDIWLEENSVSVDQNALFSFALYSIVLTFCYAESAFANGMSKLRTELFCYIAAVLLKLPVTFAVSKLTNEWHVVVLANALCLFPYIIIQPIIFRRDAKTLIS